MAWRRGSSYSGMSRTASDRTHLAECAWFHGSVPAAKADVMAKVPCSVAARPRCSSTLSTQNGPTHDSESDLMDLLQSVERCFLLTGQGLVVTPDSPLPHDKHTSVCAVIVERPDGTKLPAEAHLRFAHFRPGGFKLMV